MSMLETYREQRDAAAAALSDLIAGEASEESFAAVEAREAEIADLDSKISTLESAEARKAQIVEARAEAKVPTFGSAKVVSEPMTYSEQGERSFVRDMVRAHLNNDRTSWDALHRHMDEVRVETRAVGRADGAIGEFVPPLNLGRLAA